MNVLFQNIIQVNSDRNSIWFWYSLCIIIIFITDLYLKIWQFSMDDTKKGNPTGVRIQWSWIEIELIFEWVVDSMNTGVKTLLLSDLLHSIFHFYFPPSTIILFKNAIVYLIIKNLWTVELFKKWFIKLVDFLLLSLSDTLMLNQFLFYRLLLDCNHFLMFEVRWNIMEILSSVKTISKTLYGVWVCY